MVSAGRSLLLVLLTAIAVRAEQTTTKDGIYTAAQSERAKVVWAKACAACHTLGTLSTSTKGAPLTGDAFFKKWAGKSAYELINIIKTTMPEDFSMDLTDAEAADVTALIFQENGFPAGDKELPPGDPAKQITIIK